MAVKLTRNQKFWALLLAPFEALLGVSSFIAGWYWIAGIQIALTASSFIGIVLLPLGIISSILKVLLYIYTMYTLAMTNYFITL